MLSARAAVLACGVLLLVLGLGYALYTPPYQIPDETAHFFRVYNLTRGICKEPLMTHIPIDVYLLMKEFPSAMDGSDTVDDLRERLTRAKYRPRTNTELELSVSATASGYSCLTYLPGASGTALANLLRLPMIDALYAARVGNVVAFALAATIGLLLLPLAMRPFALLVLGMPMALGEAGSASQDGVVNGVTFLFAAYVAHLAWSERSGTLTRREIVTLLALTAALGQCKLNFLLAPLVLLIPAERWRGGWRQGLAATVGVAATGAVSLGLWQHFGATPAETSPFVALDTAANIRFLVADPGVLLNRLVATFQLNSWFYVESFVGRLGWLSVQLPALAIDAYALALLAAMIAAVAPAPLTPARRLVSLAAAGGVTAVTFVVFWVVASPVLITQYALGTGYIEGVQGRYFIPYAVPLGFALAGVVPAFTLRTERAQRWALAACAGLVVAISAVAYGALYRAFYYPEIEARTLPAGLRHPARLFDGQFIQQGTGQSVDGQIFYVLREHRYWIETPRWFRKHHLTNVRPRVVPPVVFRRIPFGVTVYDADMLFTPSSTAVKYSGQYVTDGSSIFLVVNGVRHQFIDPSYVTRWRYPVVRVPARELADIPVGDPYENFRGLDGQLIRAVDAPDAVERGRIYLVDGGFKRWVVSESWLTAHGRRIDQARELPLSTVDRIPEGLPIQ